MILFRLPQGSEKKIMVSLTVIRGQQMKKGGENGQAC